MTNTAPIQPDPDFARGAALVQTGRYSEAVAVLRGVVVRDPYNHEALQHLAIAGLTTGDGALARDAIERALIVLPDCPEYLIVHAEACRSLGDLEAARADLTRLRDLQPTNFVAWNNAAVVEKAAGNRAAAAEMLQEAIRLKPDYVDAYYNYARLDAQYGDLNGAAAALAAARKLAPDDPRFRIEPAALQAAQPPPPTPNAEPPAPTGPTEPDPAPDLAAALVAGRLRATVDIARHGNAKGPLYAQADENQLLAVTVAIAIGGFFVIPAIWAGAAAAVLLIAYETLKGRYVRRRIERRLVAAVGRAPSRWAEYWRFGGIVLTDPANGRRAVAPDDDWRALLSPST
jgi:tetratricopeptide (TPR) repeat protein